MSRRKRTPILVLAVCMTGLVADLPLPPPLAMSEAEAIVGRPATPGSVAGVSRRTARRN